MTTFVLVHGASHGAWCWDRFVPELEARGHRTIAVDLPAEDLTAGIAACAQCVNDAVPAGEDPAILVGHSAAGCLLPVAGQLIGASHLVFLCAMVPVEGVSGREQARADPEMITFPHGRVSFDEDGRSLAPPDVAREVYYNECSDEDAAWASAHLRWQSPRLMADPFPVGGWATIPSSYVVATNDRCVLPAWSRRISRERLGVEAIEISSDHSPFLSHPAALAAIFDELAG